MCPTNVIIRRSVCVSVGARRKSGVDAVPVVVVCTKEERLLLQLPPQHIQLTVRHIPAIAAAGDALAIVRPESRKQQIAIR